MNKICSLCNSKVSLKWTICNMNKYGYKCKNYICKKCYENREEQLCLECHKMEEEIYHYEGNVSLEDVAYQLINRDEQIEKKIKQKELEKTEGYRDKQLREKERLEMERQKEMHRTRAPNKNKYSYLFKN